MSWFRSGKLDELYVSCQLPRHYVRHHMHQFLVLAGLVLCCFVCLDAALDEHMLMYYFDKP